MNSTLDTVIARGFQLYKAGQHQEALDLFLRLLKKNPQNVDLHYPLALLYAAQKNYPKSLNHYRETLHLQPDHVEAHFHLAILLLQQQQLDAAKIQFKNVITLEPHHLQAHFYLGALLLTQDELIAAKQAFQKVLSQEEEHVEALINLGVIALKQKEDQIAIDYFTRALALDNHKVEARNNLAATFMHHDRYENALVHYEILLQTFPSDIEYLYNTAVAKMSLGHLQDAIHYFENVLEQDENHNPSLNNLGAIYLRLGKKEKAVAFLERALKANPADATSQFMLSALTQPETCSLTSTDYVTNLFNNYSLYYENHLQSVLHYTLPQSISALIRQFGSSIVAQAVDLGCGTGLCGEGMRPFTKRLIGVDLAPKMLQHAKKKAIYDELVEADILDFLVKRDETYGMVVAADVLPYLGEVDTLFSLLEKRLEPEGIFIFSHEINHTTPWALQDSMRFSHQPNYIKTLISTYHFEVLYEEQIIARQENQSGVPMMLYALKRHA